MSRTLVYVLCVLIFCQYALTSCVKEDIQSPVIHKASVRTILCYLEANDSGANMSIPLKNNIIGMYNAMVQSPDSCRLIVFFRPNREDQVMPAPAIMLFESDGHGQINGRQALRLESSLSHTDSFWTSSRFDSVYRQAIICQSYSPGINANSKNFMYEVMSEMNRLSGNDSKVLIWGSHATGWLNDHGTLSRSIGNDMGISINLPEFAEVIQQAFPAGLDCILLDACMLGTAEVVYELRNSTKTLVCSTMETPLDGYPYESIIPYFFNRDIDYQKICDAFVSYYRNGWGTTSAIDCGQIEALAHVMAQIMAQRINDFQSVDYTSVQQFGRNYRGNIWRNFSFDILDYFRQIYGNEIPSALTDQLERTILAKRLINQKQIDGTLKVDTFCGLGMYLPGAMNNSKYDTYYKQLSWYTAVGWNMIYRY